jgi:tetratricopeptide (TPR) repeat protein
MNTHITDRGRVFVKGGKKMRTYQIHTIILVFILLLTWQNLPAGGATVEEHKEQIRSFVTYNSDPNERRKIVDYVRIHCDEPNLPLAIYEVSNDFWFTENYKISSELYQCIIDYCRQSLQYIPARIWRIGCEFHLENKKEAYDLLDTFIADYNNNPQLSQWLYDIGNSCWSRAKYADSKTIYEKIVVNCPNSSQYYFARVWIIGADYWLNDYNEAHKGIENLKKDFPDKLLLQKTFRELGDSLYHKYDYQEAKTLYGYALSYGKISEEYENAKFKSTSCDQKLGNVPIENVENAAKTLISEYPDDSNIAKSVSMVANIFKEDNNYEKAGQFYQIIVNDSNNAEPAIQLTSLNICKLIDSGDLNTAEAMLNNFVADFNNTSLLAEEIHQIGAKYYGRAYNFEKEGRNDKAKEYYKKAIATWEKIVTQLPASTSYTPRACYAIAFSCFDDTSEYEKAIEYCQKVISNWPTYEDAGQVQFLLGNYYERLAKAGLISESQAAPIIEQAYEMLIEKYPNCDKVKNASLKLAELNFKKEQWDKAAVYYEILLNTFPENEKPVSILYLLGQSYDKIGKKDEAIKAYNEFLLKTPLSDPRIEQVKQRIQILTGSAKNKHILSDIVLGSIYGGCTYCTDQPFAVSCISSGYGSCVSPNCDGQTPCVCNVTGKQCYGPPTGNCRPRPGPQCPYYIWCSPNMCTTDSGTCQRWTSGSEIPCSGTLDDCYIRQ